MNDNTEVKKKALCIASLASNLDNFNRSNVEILLSLGYEVTLASNFDTDEDTNSREKISAFRKQMADKGVRTVQIDFSRRISRIGAQMKSISQVRELLRSGFDIIHCHSPICAAITRAAAAKLRRRYGTKVLYTAHGFHFYAGAPKKNWLVYYPVERLMSKKTDVLITINTEDYALAKKRFRAADTRYVHGIGVDIGKMESNTGDPESVRSAVGIAPDEIMLLSVGELNANKNHAAVIRALARLGRPELCYCIAGIGVLEDELKALADELGVKLFLLGFRNDIPQLCKAADLFVFPSIREGLSLALMEAVACGTPAAVGNIRGNRDLIGNGASMFDPLDVDSIAECIGRLTAGGRTSVREGMKAETEANLEVLRLYDISNVKAEMTEIYRNC